MPPSRPSGCEPFSGYRAPLPRRPVTSRVRDLVRSASVAVPAHFRRTGRAIPLHARLRRSSQLHLDLVVSSAVVLVNHAEAVSQAEKAFRVAHEQVAAGIQAAVELIDQSLLLG